MSVIRGTTELKKKLRQVGPAILPYLIDPVMRQADNISLTAAVSVPREDGELAASQFTDGPQVDPKALRVGATVGYEAPHAPYAHEGHHFGRKNKTPPKWLEYAADGRERAFVKDVEAAINAGLESLAER